MSDTPSNTLIIILGTVHVGSKSAPQYIRKLAEILTEIRPDVICAELSSEQLGKKTSSQSKPEYAEVILPYAVKNAVEVVPIQPSDKAGLKMEKEMSAIFERLKSDERDSIRLEYSNYLEQVSENNWIKLLSDPIGFENVQLREFDLLAIEPQWMATKHFFPELADLWTNWNQHFLDKIVETIQTNAVRRILVTAGLAHKYWLWEELKSRDDVDVHNLQSLRRSLLA